MNISPSNYDRSYEWKAVTLLSLGFGLVGLDRWIIAPLFPSIMKDLGLNYGQLGASFGVLSMAWGLSAIIMGGVSDKIGRRKIIIPVTILFSLLSVVTGLAVGFLSLLVIRGAMGVTEGSYTPAGVAATGEASEPRRRGLNQGLMMSLFSLFGLGFGPIIATQLLTILPSWRWVFTLVAIPGFILAIFLYKIIREPAHINDKIVGPAQHGRWVDVFKHRNMWLGMIALCCAMCGIFVLGALMPNYLVDYLHLTSPQMGFVMSGLGFGGFLGNLILPGLSDFVGRRLVAILSFLLGAILLGVFIRLGANQIQLFTLLFFIAFFCFGVLALITGPVATEAVAVTLIGSSIGLISGAGEIFGGGVAPAIAGAIAQYSGVQNTLYLALAGLTFGVVISFFLKETAPRRSSRFAVALPTTTELVER